MNKYASLFLVSLVIFHFWGASNALAHQQKSAETTMLMSKDGKQLEISHRFYLHDTEHAVKAILNKEADIINSTQTQQAFADYVKEQFAAKKLNGEKLNLTSVGYEVEGKFFWVYQEAKLSKKLDGIKIFNGTLRELWPTQINMVNIEGQGNIKTLYFNEQQDWLTVNF